MTVMRRTVAEVAVRTGLGPLVVVTEPAVNSMLESGHHCTHRLYGGEMKTPHSESVGHFSKVVT
jgi:hypothetical protein